MAKDIVIPWGTIGYITYKRTYAREMDELNSKTEEFKDTIKRVLVACNEQLKVGFNEHELEKAYRYCMELKFSVAGRFLWQLGTRTVSDLGLASLQNCAFVNIDNPIRPFTWIFDMLMLGVGVGFNVQNHIISKLPPVLDKDITITRKDTKDADFIIPDSREGWVYLLEKVLESYFFKGKSFSFSTVLIRSAGSKINGFGGVASGPESLCHGIQNISIILSKARGRRLTSVECLDIINIIAEVVVAGNVRRCLPKGSLVHTKDGLVNIEDVKVNDQVLVADGTYRNVNAVFVQGKQHVIKIITEDGEFTCTANHKMAKPYNNAQGYTWVHARDLEVDDYLISSRYSIQGKEQAIDTRLAWLMGVYACQYQKNPKQNVLYFNINEYENRDVLDKMINRIGNDLYYIGVKSHNLIKNEQMMIKAESFDFNSPHLKSYFELCSKIDSYHIPDYIKSGERHIRLAFISGILDAAPMNDYTASFLNVHSLNIQWLRELQSLCYSCGFETRVSVEQNNMYLTAVTDVAKYTISRIPTLVTTCEPLDQVYKYSTLYPVKIVGIQYLEHKVETYDISVEDKHSFFCNGYLTHNSALLAIGDHDDLDYLRAKRWDLGTIPNWRCMSNNSVVCRDISTLPDEFWEGYKGNGEPYGLINLDLARKTGRTDESGILYPDPEVNGFNPCLTADTFIATKNGIQPIDHLVNVPFEVLVNHGEYKYSRGFVCTGIRKVRRITLKTGQSVTATSNHLFRCLDNETNKIEWKPVNQICIGELIELSNDSVYDIDYEKLTYSFVYETGHTQGCLIRRNVLDMNPDHHYDRELEYYIGLLCGLCNVSHIQFVNWNKLIDITSTFTRIAKQYVLALASSLGVKSEHVFIYGGKYYSHVVSLFDLEVEKYVYDCSVQWDEHRFSANGVVSHNCAEQSLSNYETCCLSELFLPNIKSYQEACDVIEIAYRICKHSLALKCHQEETDVIVKKNMRIGIGITGYMQCSDEQRQWLPDLYKHIRQYDVHYSNAHHLPTSIKLTTVKPSGTLSLLSGVTPGAHPGIYPYFIRRIRMSASNPLVKVCRDKHYPVEYQLKFDGTFDHSTVVISFPCKYPEQTVFAKDINAIDQLEIIKRLQHDWSDNAVSVTIYYKKEELESIKEWLKYNFTENIKTVSFLLHQDHGFKQAPYEEISREEYLSMVQQVDPINDMQIPYIQGEYDDSFECPGGMCPMR